VFVRSAAASSLGRDGILGTAGGRLPSTLVGEFTSQQARGGSMALIVGSGRRGGGGGGGGFLRIPVVNDFSDKARDGGIVGRGRSSSVRRRDWKFGCALRAREA